MCLDSVVYVTALLTDLESQMKWSVTLEELLHVSSSKTLCLPLLQLTLTENNAIIICLWLIYEYKAKFYTIKIRSNKPQL